MPREMERELTSLRTEAQEVLRQRVPSWFKCNRPMSGGGALILHVFSGGLPESRHPNPTAAQMQTQSALDRLKRYEEVLELLGNAFRTPICLLELSRSEIRTFFQYAPMLEEATRLGPDLESCVIPEEHIGSVRHAALWNPALRQALEGGVDVESRWARAVKRRLHSDIAARAGELLHALQSKRRAGAFPVCLVYTEEALTFADAVRAWNLPYFAAHQVQYTVEYFTITEPW